jgi:hypothetical protein
VSLPQGTFECDADIYWQTFLLEHQQKRGKWRRCQYSDVGCYAVFTGRMLGFEGWQRLHLQGPVGQWLPHSADSERCQLFARRHAVNTRWLESTSAPQRNVKSRWKNLRKWILQMIWDILYGACFTLLPFHPPAKSSSFLHPESGYFAFKR